MSNARWYLSSGNWVVNIVFRQLNLQGASLVWHDDDDARRRLGKHVSTVAEIGFNRIKFSGLEIVSCFLKILKRDAQY